MSKHGFGGPRDYSFFAIGHTLGFLGFHPPTAEGEAVWQAMQRVRFSDGHGSFSYGEFYSGFGLFISVFLLFTSGLSWILDSMPRWRNSCAGVDDGRVGACLGRTIAAVLLVDPGVFSVAVALCPAMGAGKMKQSEDTRAAEAM